MDSKHILLIIFVILGFGLSTFLFYDKTKLNAILNHEIDTLNSTIVSNDLLMTEKNEEVAGLKTTNDEKSSKYI